MSSRGLFVKTEESQPRVGGFNCQPRRLYCHIHLDQSIRQNKLFKKFPTILTLFHVLKFCEWGYEDDKIQPNNLGLNNYLQSPKNKILLELSLKGLFSIILCEPLTIKHFLTENTK